MIASTESTTPAGAPPRDTVEVLVPVAVAGQYHYRVPPHFASRAKVGARVLVRFGGKVHTGVIARVGTTPPVEVKRLLALTDILDDEPSLSQELVDLCQWIASYYEAPPGEVIKAALPAGSAVTARRMLTLTESGESALEGALPAKIRALLARLEEGALPIVGMNQTQRKGYAPLIEQGYVIELEEREASRARLRHERVVELAMDLEKARELVARAPKRLAVVNALVEGPRVISTLGVKNPGGVAREMEKLGVVKISEREAELDAAPINDAMTPTTIPTPTAEQAVAIAAIIGTLRGFADRAAAERGEASPRSPNSAHDGHDVRLAPANPVGESPSNVGSASPQLSVASAHVTSVMATSSSSLQVAEASALQVAQLDDPASVGPGRLSSQQIAQADDPTSAGLGRSSAQQIALADDSTSAGLARLSSQKIPQADIAQADDPTSAGLARLSSHQIAADDPTSAGLARLSSLQVAHGVDPTSLETARLSSLRSAQVDDPASVEIAESSPPQLAQRDTSSSHPTLVESNASSTTTSVFTPDGPFGNPNLTANEASSSSASSASIAPTATLEPARTSASDVVSPVADAAGSSVTGGSAGRSISDGTNGVAAVDSSAAKPQFVPFLLHGVTGSGKTEVYLRVIAEALELGKTALVLVPEISLTPQLAARFRARFGDQVAILHSGLKEQARLGEWSRLRRGTARIAVGARSAIFAPLTDLGVIVVDEEHDGSFKQEEGVRYHARDVALVRAQRAGAVCVLGSATPSLESYAHAERGQYQLLVLSQRPTSQPMPSVEVVDLRVHVPDGEAMVSSPLRTAIGETLANGDQAILFLNRRGFSTFVMCRACGHSFRCKWCSVSYTYHRSTDKLTCHYCATTESIPDQCPECKGHDTIVRKGLGTEKIAEAIAEEFPQARVARLDRDVASGAKAEAILSRVARREVDILVGTQMVTKGHDFPGVTLVGVLCADTGLDLPDFRASERTFQLLAQVAGRAGRGERLGRVIVQTYRPGSSAVVAAAAHDYAMFYKAEYASRADLHYPPHGRLILVRIDGKDENAVAGVARKLARVAEAASKSGEPANTVEVLGPAAAPIEKLRNRTRWQVWLRGTDRNALRRIARIVAATEVSKSVRVILDVDPNSSL